jgi:hypothetical protein
VKPRSAGEPYTARRIHTIQRRIEQLARRDRMVDLLAEGLDAFIGFQVASVQAEIQRDISKLSEGVRGLW